MKENTLNRRSFIQGAVTLGAIGGLSLVGCSGQTTEKTSSEDSTPTDEIQQTEEKKVSLWVDAVSSASVATNMYTNLTGEQLTGTINSFSAACTFATTNEDGTPNLAVFAGGLQLKDEYIVFNWGENQTKANLKRDGLGVVSFDVVNLTAETKEERHKGARIKVEYVDDAKIKEELSLESEAVVEATTIVRIAEVLPVG